MGVLRVLALMCLSANGRGQVRGRGGGGGGREPDDVEEGGSGQDCTVQANGR